MALAVCGCDSCSKSGAPGPCLPREHQMIKSTYAKAIASLGGLLALAAVDPAAGLPTAD